MAPQHLARTHVARVARVARHGVARVAERVVVVGDGDDAGTAMDEWRQTPRARQRGDDLFEQALHGVHAFSGIGEVAHFQCARHLGGRYRIRTGTTSSSSAQQAGDEPPGRRRRAEPGVSARVPLGALSGPGGKEIAARCGVPRIRW